LIVAPGLIVYDRLLDAYLGKVQEDGTGILKPRISSSLKSCSSLLATRRRFLVHPVNVVRKDEIGRKVTGDGLIAITNCICWPVRRRNHL